ncbi:MAG TPA: MAPEG family protein [Steroidobacteraceae bacterium]|nr:MAPEG family protein [Steroidobacteraceae bacterium]
MPLVSIVILLAILEFLVLGGMVGRARGKYGVKAPATTGNEMFERHFRVHYNTLEHLIAFIPSIWLFGVFLSEMWAAILGVVFIVARAIYAFGYVSDPKKREVGALLTVLAAEAPLVLGALYGAIRAALGA